MAWRTVLIEIPYLAAVMKSVLRFIARATVVRDCTTDAQHFGHASNDLHHTREMLAIAYAQFEHQRGTVGVLLFHGDAFDVGVARGNGSRNRGEHAHLVFHVHAN